MWRIAVLIVTALAATTPGEAEGKGSKNTSAVQDAVVEQTAVNRRAAAFSPAERNLIRAHLLAQQRGGAPQSKQPLPPGLQKKVARGKDLPPGWQKKLTPGQGIDEQIYRHGESLPDFLLRRLPPPPVGSEILQIEDRIVRLNSATRTVLDVFDLIPGP